MSNAPGAFANGFCLEDVYLLADGALGFRLSAHEIKSQDRKPPAEALSGDSRGLSVSSAGRWLLGSVILILLLAGALLMTLPSRKSPLLVDPRFVVTTKPN